MRELIAILPTARRPDTSQAASVPHDRLADGRARLQAAILDAMRKSHDTWHTCAALGQALGVAQSNARKALVRLERKGLVESRRLETPVRLPGHGYAMHRIIHHRLTGGRP